PVLRESISARANQGFSLFSFHIHHSARPYHATTSMSEIDQLFVTLRSQNRKALMPFVTAGDPDLDFTSSVLREIVTHGASLFEVGSPSSDPIADGPVIQASYTRALAAKVKLGSIFDMLGHSIPSLSAPVVTMVSYAIVYRKGLE